MPKTSVNAQLNFQAKAKICRVQLIILLLMSYNILNDEVIYIREYATMELPW